MNARHNNSVKKIAQAQDFVNSRFGGTSMGDLLKELPSFNRHNFSKYASDSATKPTNRRPVVYLPTKEDGATEQVIVTDKANILLRYLHQQWEVKNTQSGKKRDVVSADLPETSELNPSRKAKRLDHEDYSPPD